MDSQAPPALRTTFAARREAVDAGCGSRALSLSLRPFPLSSPSCGGGVGFGERGLPLSSEERFAGAHRRRRRLGRCAGCRRPPAPLFSRCAFRDTQTFHSIASLLPWLADRSLRAASLVQLATGDLAAGARSIRQDRRRSPPAAVPSCFTCIVASILQEIKVGSRSARFYPLRIVEGACCFFIDC